MSLDDPAGKFLKRIHIRSVMLLSELEQLLPPEVRIYPRTLRVHQLTWWTHHLILLRTQKERQRLPRTLAVHHCPVQTTLVPPVR